MNIKKCNENIKYNSGIIYNMICYIGTNIYILIGKIKKIYKKPITSLLEDVVRVLAAEWSANKLFHKNTIITLNRIKTPFFAISLDKATNSTFAPSIKYVLYDETLT